MRTVDTTYIRGYTPKGNEQKGELHMEYFNSNAEVVAVCERRAPDYCNPANTHDNYFSPTFSHYINAKWSGFSSVDELKSKIREGCKDKSLVADVNRFTHTARTPDVHKLAELGRDLAGGAVDVPRFLTGSPDCMRTLKKKKVKSSIIKIGFNVSVTYDISIETSKRIGVILSKAILSVEKAGYRTEVLASCLFGDIDTKKNYITGFVVPVKKADAALNIPRLLYPLCDMSFFRGLGFGWVVQDPKLTADHGLSTTPGSKMNMDYEDECLMHLYASIFGKDAVFFDFSTLVKRLNRDGDEKLESYMISKLISSGEDLDGY